MTWSIKVQPATPSARLPDDLAVTVSIVTGVDDPRTVAARSLTDGAFSVTLTPVPRDPDRMVGVDAYFGGQMARVEIKDGEVKVGNRKFLASDLREIYTNPPRVTTARGEQVLGPVQGLSRVKPRVAGKPVLIDLGRATSLAFRPLDPPPPVRSFEARVEARQKSRVLAAVVKRIEFAGAPAGSVHAGPGRIAAPASPRPARLAGKATDQDFLKIGGALKAIEAPVGAGGSIRPPSVPMAVGNPTAPLVRTLGGTISDAVVGGGGRYLLLLLGGAKQLAVFDMNEAGVVKTIPLTSDNALIAAGASKFVVAYPDEKVMDRWDMGSMTRDRERAPSPIRARLRSLTWGSDSDGPLLASWTMEGPESGTRVNHFSFISVDTLSVVRPGRFSSAARSGDGLSVSGGSFTLGSIGSDEIYVRASAGGTLFGIWRRSVSPAGFQTLLARGDTLAGTFKHDSFGYLAPGHDGWTIFAGRGGRYDFKGEPIGRPEELNWDDPMSTIPSTDPRYYLRMSGRRMSSGRTPDPSRVTASVHLASDGSRLLGFGVDEMAGTLGIEPQTRGDLTLDKRVHYVPAARMVLTIPPTNDRLVLRRLDVAEAFDRLDGDYLLVTSSPVLAGRAGQTIEHQIVTRSRRGSVSFRLSQGPEGLAVSHDGMVTYRVPRQPGGERLKAVITVSDASGQERFHTIEIHIE